MIEPFDEDKLYCPTCETYAKELDQHSAQLKMLKQEYEALQSRLAWCEEENRNVHKINLRLERLAVSLDPDPGT